MTKKTKVATTKTAKLVILDSAGVSTTIELKIGKTKGGNPKLTVAKETATIHPYGSLYLKH